MNTSFPIWRTLTLGTFKSIDDLHEAFEKAKMKISPWANDLLNQPAFKLASKKTEVELVKVTVAELGFKDGATYTQICVRAKELGLDLCPAEVGPQLRLWYKDQPKGDWLLVAMEPITDSDGDPHLFYVSRDGDGRWLSRYCGDADEFWDGDDWFVFLRRK